MFSSKKKTSHHFFSTPVWNQGPNTLGQKRNDFKIWKKKQFKYGVETGVCREVGGPDPSLLSLALS